MKAWKNKAKYAGLILLSSGMLQCSNEKSLESDFDAVLTNSSPLVRTTERTFATSTVGANWFDLKMKVTNKTEYAVRIEEVLVYVTVDGVESGPHSFDLGLLNVTNEETGESWEYFDYCTYPKFSGGTAVTYDLSACANGFAGAPVPGSAPDAVALTLYLGDLPKPTNPANLSFPARVELHGVFLNDQGLDQERFLKTVYFTTR